ncbi:MAG TPA: hypothetical protein VGP24_01565 [Glaciihabitans sp.]|nr:hypothetical protein [Glaciihabitans sp.]
MGKNQVLGATLSIVILGTALVGCSTWSFGDRLIDAARAQTNGGVQLGSVLDGDWDHYLVVCPYDPDVSSRLGFTWEKAPNTAESDSSQLIVFVGNGEVVSSPRVSRATIDLCSGDSWELQPREVGIHFVVAGGRLLGSPLPG